MKIQKLKKDITCYNIAEPKNVTNLTSSTKTAFTLAEVLITLAIIGIVAVLVIPPLIRNYQSRSWSTASDLFQKRLTEATKQMNTQGQLLGYSSTEDFVNNGLSKYMKIIKKCNKDELDKCFSPKFNYGSEELETSSLTTASNFGKDNWSTDPYGIILDNGTTALLVYNKDCSYIDPYNNQIDGTSCLSVAYDVNGMKTPNTINQDLFTMNASLSKYACISKGLLNETGVCLTQSLFGINFTVADCLKIKDEYGLKYCYGFWISSGSSDPTAYDRFAGAVVACGGLNHVASEAQLEKIAQYVYKREDIPDTIFDSDKLDDLVLDPDRWKEVSGKDLPSSGSAYYMIVNEELPVTSRYKTRAFATNRTYNSASWERGWASAAFCVR